MCQRPGIEVLQFGSSQPVPIQIVPPQPMTSAQNQ